MNIVPRSVIGVPAPTGRPLLPGTRAWLLCHYTGSTGYNDPTKDLAYARSVAAYGAAAGKAYEYNYLIGLGGSIFEQAGPYRAAHCLNFNNESVGVLMMVGVGVQPTREMIDAFRWLRAHLVETRLLAGTNSAVPHYRFRSTACPGITLAQLPRGPWSSPTGQGSLGNLRSELLEPWIPAAHPQQEDDMPFLIKDNDADVWLVMGIHRVWVTPNDYPQLVGLYGKERLVGDVSAWGIPVGVQPA